MVTYGENHELLSEVEDGVWGFSHCLMLRKVWKIGLKRFFVKLKIFYGFLFVSFALHFQTLPYTVILCACLQDKGVGYCISESWTDVPKRQSPNAPLFYSGAFSSQNPFLCYIMEKVKPEIFS